MSETGIAIADEVEVVTSRPGPEESTRPKTQPPYAVILLNDDDHTFAYVIEVLGRVCGHGRWKAFKLAWTVHTAGRAVVWTGALEVAELKRDQIRGFGADPYARKTVEYPLGCVIEPLPG
jgi:ATP-dependent Clp protease adaptor protein ClpS